MEKDYKKSLSLVGKQTIIEITNNKFATETAVAKKGGQNIQKFYLNVKTFKSLCLKAQTRKADEIHEYYIKLEELIQEVLEEETNELKTLLSQKENTIKNADQDKFKAIEKTLVAQFPVNNECIYFGTIDNANEKGDKLIKFGHSNNLPLRVQDHHKNYDNFIKILDYKQQLNKLVLIPIIQPIYKYETRNYDKLKVIFSSFFL